jgi:hypothetical protein
MRCREVPKSREHRATPFEIVACAAKAFRGHRCMRRTEVSQLKIHDIDSKRMRLRVERGKGGVSRDLLLGAA